MACAARSECSALQEAGSKRSAPDRDARQRLRLAEVDLASIVVAWHARFVQLLKTVLRAQPRGAAPLAICQSVPNAGGIADVRKSERALA